MTIKRRSEREPHRVAASFGQRSLEIAAAVGKSKQDLMDGADMSVSTFNRLLRGEGSPLAAIRVKNLLRSWGADVSALPAVDSDDDAGDIGPMAEPLREGFELLKRLYQLASDERFRVELDHLGELVRAHELVAEGTGRRDRLKP